jgi:hypothetical protein
MNNIRSKIRNADKIQYRIMKKAFTIDEKYLYGDNEIKVRVKFLYPQLIKDKQIKDTIKIVANPFCYFNTFKRFGYVRRLDSVYSGYRGEVFNKNNFDKIETMKDISINTKTSIKRKAE